MKRSALLMITALCLLLSSCADDSASTETAETEASSEKSVPTDNADTDKMTASDELTDNDSKNEPLQSRPDLPLTEYFLSMSVPDFLTEEQQYLYRCACSIYPTFTGNPDHINDYPADEEYTVAYEAPIMIEVNSMELRYHAAKGKYRLWDDFVAMGTSIFTDSYFAELSDMFHGVDGITRIPDVAKGSRWGYMEDVQEDTFRLTSKTDTEIRFDVIGHYFSRTDDGEVDLESMTTESFPIVMVLTNSGWRFDKFASPAGDEQPGAYRLTSEDLYKKVLDGEIKYENLHAYSAFKSDVSEKLSQLYDDTEYFSKIKLFLRDEPSMERYPFTALLPFDGICSRTAEIGIDAVQLGEDISYRLSVSPIYHIYGRYTFGDVIIGANDGNCINRTQLEAAVSEYGGLSKYSIDFGNITLDGYDLNVPMTSDNGSVSLEITIGKDMEYSITAVSPANT